MCDSQSLLFALSYPDVSPLFSPQPKDTSCIPTHPPTVDCILAALTTMFHLLATQICIGPMLQ
jgi:hypothetical protein